MSVFISYSRADQEWLHRVREYLDILDRRFNINSWDDTKIIAGTAWQAEIQKALKRAEVAILLVSPAFLNSDFIQREEVPALLTKARGRGTLILPLIVRHCLYNQLPVLSHFQAFNSPQQPLTSLSNSDQDEILEGLAAQVYTHLRAGNSFPIPDGSQSYDKEEFKRSLTQIVLLRTLNQRHLKVEANTVTNLQAASGLGSRKLVIQTLYQFLAEGIVEQNTIENAVNWRLSEKGLQWSNEVSDLLDH